MSSYTMPPRPAYPNSSDSFNHPLMQDQHISVTEPFSAKNPKKGLLQPDKDKLLLAKTCIDVLRRYLERRPVSNLSPTKSNLLIPQQIWLEEKITSTFYTFENQLQYLELMYSFRDKRRVLQFLEMNKFLIPLLLEAKLYITSFFPESEIFLEIDIDPEAAMNKQLVAFIATNLSPNEALSKLKQLDKAWWLGVIDQAEGKLYINLEFI